jgi:hypothetical protein
MSVANRRDRRARIQRIKPKSSGLLPREKVSLDLLESRVMFTVLPAPTGLVATAPSTGEVDLSWNNSNGETGYIIKANTGTVTTPVWTSIATPAANTTSYAVTSLPGTGSTTVPLTAGTLYSFQLIAVDADGNSPASSPSASATTIPAAPTLTASVTSTTAVTLNWAAVTGATSYLLSRSTDLSTWTAVTTVSIVSPATTPATTYTDTGRAANTAYYYRLQAVDGSGDSDYSLITSATTLLSAPTGITPLALSTTQMSLSWPSEAGAYGYTLQQETGTTWNNVVGAGSLSSSTNVFVVGNLTANTSYNFRLIASNISGPSAPSTTITDSTLEPAPALTSVAASTTSNTLTWTAVGGATGYVLQNSPDASVWTTIASPLSTVSTYTDTSDSADTTYFYRLAAVNAGGDSAWSAVNSQTTNIVANSAFTATSASSYSITLGWASQATASGFKVQEQTGTGQTATWAQVGDIVAAGSTSYTVTGLQPNTAYTFRLITENAGGDSAASSTATATTRLPRTRVTGFATSDTAVTLNWTNITGNTGYVVSVSPDNTNWYQLPALAANTITDSVTGYPVTANGNTTTTAFTADTLYYFRVQSTNANGASSMSNLLHRTTLVVAPASLAATNNATNALTLGWTDSSGNGGYIVQKEIRSTWITLATLATSTDTYSVTGLHAGNAYNFQVMAIDGGGFSIASPLTASTLTKSTVVTAAGASTSAIAVSWTPIPGVTSYNVETSPDNGANSDWVSNTVATGTTTYTDSTPATANVQGYYRVAGVNSGGTGAFSSVVSSYSLLAAPTTFTATSLSDTSISLSWDSETAAAGFRLQKQGTGSTWIQIGGLLPSSSTSYIVPNLTANTAYTFRLIAKDLGGDSAPSTTSSATTKVAAPVVALGTVADTTVALSWPAITGATGYKVWRSTTPDVGFTSTSVTMPSTIPPTFTYTDSTAAQGTVYYYYVTASTTNGGDSLPSNTVNPTTLMTAPTGVTAVSSETTSIDISWTSVAGATGYIVQQQGSTSTTWTQVGSTLPGEADTANVASLTAGTSYTFRVIAVDAAGNSLPSTVATTSTLLAAPVATVVAASTTSNTITWPSITGATAYVIQRSSDGANWTSLTAPTLATGATQTYTDSTGLSAGTEYFYRVAATDAGGTSQYSTVAGTTTLLAAPTGFTATAASNNSITLAWNAQVAASGFIVQVEGGTTAAPTWTQVGDQIEEGSTGTTIDGLNANTAYVYRLIAVDDGGSSPASATATATTAPTVTKLSAVPLSDTVIALSWTAVPGAIGYTLSEASGGGTTYTALTPNVGATTTDYTVSGLTSNTAYSFYVTVLGTGSSTSAPSNTVNTGTLLSPPTTFAVAADTTNPNTSLDLSWDQSTGNVGYLVQKLVGTVWTNVATTSTGTNSYVATGLLGGVTYSFRVCALNVSGTSLPSTSASLATG